VIPFGNLLGVVLVCVIACPIVIIAAMARPGASPAVGSRLLGLLIPFTVLVVGAIDVRLRSGRPTIAPFKRWFSPYEGATFVAFPIWLCCAALLLATLASVAKLLR